MSDYKYPYVPKNYYPAVMCACSCIRKYGTFNRAIEYATRRYGVDAAELEKHVRKRQGAGQKTAAGFLPQCQEYEEQEGE